MGYHINYPALQPLGRSFLDGRGLNTLLSLPATEAEIINAGFGGQKGYIHIGNIEAVIKKN